MQNPRPFPNSGASNLLRTCGVWLATAAAGLGLWVGAGASAQTQHSLREYMFGHSAQDGRQADMPRTAHFSSEAGDSFVLDTTQFTPVVRFDGSDEVIALTPVPGPHGDVVFKDDVGQTILRSSRWGGITLFTPDHPTGDPVALDGVAHPIDPGRLTPEALFQVLARASVRASAAAGRLIGFSADEDSPRAQTDYLFADAANNTSNALVTLSRQHNGPTIISHVREVRLTEGRPPGVTLKEGVLELKLDASRGWSGRPSSRRVMDVIRQTGHALH